MPTREKYQKYIEYYKAYNDKRKEYRRLYYLKDKEKISDRKRLYRLEHLEEARERSHKYYQKYHKDIKEKTKKYYFYWKYYNKFRTLFHYSDGKLSCLHCGENIFELLTIDHILGGGNKHRKAMGLKNIYVWLRRNNFPSGYQVLCYNCNLVKSRVSLERYEEIITELQTRQLYMGGCPSQKEVI
jgi:hypothetical protein